jgi:hypothetical protein
MEGRVPRFAADTDMNGTFDQVALGLNVYPSGIRGWSQW